MTTRTNLEHSNDPAGNISLEQQSYFRSAMGKLLGINAVSFGLSVFNEAVIGHSAIGFNQAAMEATDTFMVAGLETSHRADLQGMHLVASRRRKMLYGLHIGTAGLGAFEAVRLFNQQSAPSTGNLVISGVVGALNLGYLRHKRKHREGVAHTKTPDFKMAFEDPIEVVQDEVNKYPDAATMHALNEDGTTAIAHTNLVEAAGGILGAASGAISEQSPGVVAVASSVGVICVMANQISKERRIINSQQ